MNGVALTLQVQDTNQSIVIPAYTSVITPIYTGNLQFAFNIIANLNTLPHFDQTNIADFLIFRKIFLKAVRLVRLL